MLRLTRRRVLALGATVFLLLGSVAVGSVAASAQTIDFTMVRSSGAVAAGCLRGASGDVTVTSIGPVEVMRVTLDGLPRNTEFDLFVIQVPNAPFGVSWYQGDLKTDGDGHASGRFIGRFSVETFALAPGTAPAPVVHEDRVFPDASSNPAFGPIHTYHLGLWFNDPDDAKDAGCPDTVTPFNGVHHAGIQALSTRNFADDRGPLRQLKP